MTAIVISKQKKKKASQTARITALERQVAELRSVMSRVTITEYRDPEGEYRPEFMREILNASKEKPTRRFKDAESFLVSLRSA